MKQFLITVAGVVAGMFIFCVLGLFLLFGFIGSLAASSSNEARLNHPTVLELDLRQGLSDQDPVSASLFTGSKMSVLRVIETLRYAEKDAKVRGLLVRLPEGGISPAAADELRLAFRHFRMSGKPIMAHSQGLYPDGLVVSTYELAASTGEVWMQPDSSFQATGIATSDMFLKGLFDKYGVKADYQQRYEYKNAVNPYLYTDYTPAHREANLSWMGSVYDTAISQAAFDRKKDVASLKATIEAGPYSAEDAVAKGLVDKVGQVHDAEQALKDRAGDGSKIVDFDDYATAVKPLLNTQGSSTIAVIGAEGDIVTGHGAGGAFSTDSNIYSDDEARAFYDAIKDDNVKAIVFRVSSPGGSDTASEQILAAMKAAKAAGKPVVVSMGTYAASGGYWISSNASSIIAEPSTLTGSIGVFGGKFVIGDALARYGVNMRDLSVGGQYADSFAGSKEFTPAQRAAFSAWMDHIYDGFVKRVSAGRNIPEARVREIAKGHVWTGAQAKQLGLVDQIGGFYDAIDKAKALAKIPADEDVKLKAYPHERSFFESLSHGMGVSETSIKTLAALGWVFSDPRAESILEQLGRAHLQAQGKGAVLAPKQLPAN